MKCPDKTFLQSFALDPDAALEAVPEFGFHLSECAKCKLHLDSIGESQQALEISELLMGPSQRSNTFPDVEGYAIQEFVGAGASGAVYKAEQVRSGLLVAIKIVSSVTADQWKRINTERQTLIQCDHSNIVQLLDYGQRQEGCYFVTRWVEKSLARSIQESSAIDLNMAVDWTIQTTSAVCYLHGLGIIHRDLKPSNILLTSTGVAKLTDFGIAKDLKADITLTGANVLLGTPGYMAPEQAGKKDCAVGFATDVYGLGAVLYSLIAGRPPFVGSNSMQLISQVLHEDPIPIRKLRPETPKDLETICQKCLQKNPQDRYRSAQELSEDLSRFRNGMPVMARPTPRPVLVWRSMVKQRMLVGMIVLICCLSVLSAATLIQTRRQNKLQQNELAKLALLNAIGSASTEKLPQLFAEATFQIGKSLPSIDATNASPLEKLRWLCVAPESSQIILNPSERIQACQALTCVELSILLPKLSQNTQFRSDEFCLAVDQALIESNQEAIAIRLACLRTELDSNWRPSQVVIHRILTGLSQTPVEESVLWSKMLDGIRNALLEELLGPTNEIGHRELLQAQSLRTSVWQWVRRDGAKIASFLEMSPMSTIELVQRTPPTAIDRSVQKLEDEYHHLRRRMELKQQPKSISKRLQVILDRSDGFLGPNRGAVHSIGRENLDELLEALIENRFSLLAIQPYEVAGQHRFCAVFEDSDEPCEVDWLVPLEDVERQIAERRERGWEAVSSWVHMESPPRHVAMVWRKGTWGPSEFVKGNSIEAKSTLSSHDTTTYSTQFFHQQYPSGDEVCEAGLMTLRPCQVRDESHRKFMYFQSDSNIDPGPPLAAYKMEFNAGAEEIAIIRKTNPTEHARQQVLLASMGYEPFYLFAEAQTGALSSYWHKQIKLTQATDCINMAKLAIANWMMGSSSLVLDALDATSPPSLRTAVIENLGSLDSKPARLLDHLRVGTTPSQLHGFLLSLAEVPNLDGEPNRNMLREKLDWCWGHPDAGVHSAADYILRVRFAESAGALFNADFHVKFGYDPSNTERKWFYGPYGLPFVIVEKGSEALYGMDEYLPWAVQIDRHLERIERRFAICAVETPDWLMQKFLSESGLAPNNASFDFDVPPNGPAGGYSLIAMLKFCRWLSEKDGIPIDRIGLPDAAQIRQGLQLPTSVWSQDGYRLPTNVEWETAFRAGTHTRHFLGESFDYMPKYCWDSSNCEQSPKSVATRKPNPWGLFDIAGNLYEAVLGDHREFHARDSEIWGEKSLGKNTVLDIRGGSFLSSRIYSAAGSHHHVNARGDINGGFRIVRTLPDEAFQD